MCRKVVACLVAQVFPGLERGRIEDRSIHPRQALLRASQDLLQFMRFMVNLLRHALSGGTTSSRSGVQQWSSINKDAPSPQLFAHENGRKVEGKPHQP
jgi:hypothetical protein